MRTETSTTSTLAGFGNSDTLIPEDIPRLQTQLAAVQEIMFDGNWRTLEQLAAEVKARTGRGASEAGASARLRDLRKPKFGGCVVERRRVAGREGLFAYRIVAGGSGTGCLQ